MYKNCLIWSAILATVSVLAFPALPATTDVTDTNTSAIPDSQPARPYSFGYKIKNTSNGSDYRRQESSNGKVVTGSYRVPLPDGRTEVVDYVADSNGYRANVRYEKPPTSPKTSPSTIVKAVRIRKKYRSRTTLLPSSRTSSTTPSSVHSSVPATSLGVSSFPSTSTSRYEKPPNPPRTPSPSSTVKVVRIHRKYQSRTTPLPSFEKPPTSPRTSSSSTTVKLIRIHKKYQNTTSPLTPPEKSSLAPSELLSSSIGFSSFPFTITSSSVSAMASTNATLSTTTNTVPRITRKGKNISALVSTITESSPVSVSSFIGSTLDYERNSTIPNSVKSTQVSSTIDPLSTLTTRISETNSNISSLNVLSNPSNQDATPEAPSLAGLDRNPETSRLTSHSPIVTENVSFSSSNPETLNLYHSSGDPDAAAAFAFLAENFSPAFTRSTLNIIIQNTSVPIPFITNNPSLPTTSVPLVTDYPSSPTTAISTFDTTPVSFDPLSTTSAFTSVSFETNDLSVSNNTFSTPDTTPVKFVNVSVSAVSSSSIEYPSTENSSDSSGVTSSVGPSSTLNAFFSSPSSLPISAIITSFAPKEDIVTPKPELVSISVATSTVPRPVPLDLDSVPFSSSPVPSPVLKDKNTFPLVVTPSLAPVSSTVEITVPNLVAVSEPIFSATPKVTVDSSSAVNPAPVSTLTPFAVLNNPEVSSNVADSFPNLNDVPVAVPASHTDSSAAVVNPAVPASSSFVNSVPIPVSTASAVPLVSSSVTDSVPVPVPVSPGTSSSPINSSSVAAPANSVDFSLVKNSLPVSVFTASVVPTGSSSVTNTVPGVVPDFSGVSASLANSSSVAVSVSSGVSSNAVDFAFDANPVPVADPATSGFSPDSPLVKNPAIIVVPFSSEVSASPTNSSVAVLALPGVLSNPADSHPATVAVPVLPGLSTTSTNSAPPSPVVAPTPFAAPNVFAIFSAPPPVPIPTSTTNPAPVSHVENSASPDLVLTTPTVLPAPTEVSTSPSVSSPFVNAAPSAVPPPVIYSTVSPLVGFSKPIAPETNISVAVPTSSSQSSLTVSAPLSDHSVPVTFIGPSSPAISSTSESFTAPASVSVFPQSSSTENPTGSHAFNQDIRPIADSAFTNSDADTFINKFHLVPPPAESSPAVPPPLGASFLSPNVPFDIPVPSAVNPEMFSIPSSGPSGVSSVLSPNAPLPAPFLPPFSVQSAGQIQGSPQMYKLVQISPPTGSSFSFQTPGSFQQPPPTGSIQQPPTYYMIEMSPSYARQARLPIAFADDSLNSHV